MIWLKELDFKRIDDDEYCDFADQTQRIAYALLTTFKDRKDIVKNCKIIIRENKYRFSQSIYKEKYKLKHIKLMRKSFIEMAIGEKDEKVRKILNDAIQHNKNWMEIKEWEN